MWVMTPIGYRVSGYQQATSGCDTMGWQAELSQAARRFSEAQSHVEHAEELLNTQASEVPSADSNGAQQAPLAAKLTQEAHAAAPGLLSADLQTAPSDPAISVAQPPEPVHVRLGMAEAQPSHAFPVVLPLLGQGHIVIDKDAADDRVAGLLQAILLRNFACVPRLQVSLVDCVTLGQTFTQCTPMIGGQVTGPTATDNNALAAVLDIAENHVQEAQAARHDTGSAASVPYHLVVIAGLPPQASHSLKARIAALAHAGPHGRTHLLIAGWQDGNSRDPAPVLDHATYVQVAANADGHTVHGVPSPVSFDSPPPPNTTRNIYAKLAVKHQEDNRVAISTLLPQRVWSESSVNSLSTVAGRDQRGLVELSFDDATPHWLIGGRTGGGKTVFLLDVLYGLASRYAPRELSLYLLDFKEGVSFTEFSASRHDETWIPHVRAIGVESDREYGNAVLIELRNELNRRAKAMKRYGVTKLAELRKVNPELVLPRVLAVIDEFHVLFSGNDRLANHAAGHLEELARKGRAYGIHLILASQTISGVETLYTKNDSIFGQFPLRIALPGAKHVLDPLNTAAESIQLGQAVINTSGGATGFDRLMHFPDATADPEVLGGLRRDLWQQREPTDPPPKVFTGYAQQHLEDDPSYQRLNTQTNRPTALVGRAVDVDISTVDFPMDASPGRHVAVLGTSDVGADVVHAAAVSLARQHEPSQAQFLLAPLVAQADGAAEDTAETLRELGHDVQLVPAAELSTVIAELAQLKSHGVQRYLILFGGDTIAPIVGTAGQKQLRTIFKQGPGAGIHVIGWWRGYARFVEDLGTTNAREDVACLVVLNIPGQQIGAFIGDINSSYVPRDNRALIIDRHTNTMRLCVPFVRADRDSQEEL